jgi:outer membrane cobalamin receptor
LQFVKDRENQESYNAGVIVSPVRQVRLKVGYGYAFRLPTIAEQFADDTYTAGNAELSPETSRSIIGGVSYESPDSKLNAGLTVFRQEVDSLIQYQYDPTVYLSIPRNVEKFKSTGIDMSLGYRPLEYLAIDWSVVYQNAEQTQDGGKTFVSANYVPEIKWRLDVDGDVKQNRLFWNVNLTYTSDRNIVLYGGVPKTIDKVYEFGMSVSARVLDQVTVRLTGYDLTDEARPDQFGFTAGDGDYPSPGRRFLLDVAFGIL